MDENSLKLLVGLLSSIILILVTLLKMYHDRYREIMQKISDKKFGAYAEILATMFDLINRLKGLNQITNDEILKRQLDIKRDLLLYGDDKIVRKFFEWEENQLTNRRLWIWAELAALVRKDMGNQWTNITADDILKSLFSKKEDYISYKKEIFEK